MTRKMIYLEKTACFSGVEHYVGLPPSLTNDEEKRVLLPRAAVLVIEESEEGFFLFRYTATGDFAGDTWHEGLEATVEQAEREFCVGKDQWTDIPSQIEDWYSYIFKKQ